jgi:putative transcriptional regulator
MTTEMSQRIRRRAALLLLIVVALLADGAPAAEPASEPAPGQLLVAAEGMQDPRFRQSVIVLLKHDASGAFGIVINRPLGERPLAALLAGAGGDGKGLEGTIPVFFGGPVETQLGFVVHSAEYKLSGTLTAGDVAMTASKEILQDIGQHRGPARYLFAIGYAGWGKGQLEGEIARGGWHTTPADRELLFEAERDTVWEKAFARRIREM